MRYNDEKDLPAQEKTKKQGSRLQKENGFHCGKKRFKKKKKQGQKKALRITADFSGDTGEIPAHQKKLRLSKTV